MRVLFWGTPDFAVPSLRALSEEGHQVVGVVTQPDRPAGRGRRLTPSPVRQAAEEDDLPVLTPERPRGDDFVAELRELDPEISVVVAYGHILVREVLDLPTRGSINVHASLLPALRGAAPVHWAIIRGHERTGVTVMRMVEAMDAGPILLQQEEPIGETETMSELAMRLSEIGAQTLAEALALLAVDAIDEREQDHEQATYAPKVDRETARIDWSRPAGEVADLVRGMDAFPGAWSETDGRPVKFFRPVVRGPADAPGVPAPGQVVTADPDVGFVVAAGEGAVAFGEVQPSGKRRMDAADWLRGRAVAVGDRFE